MCGKIFMLFLLCVLNALVLTGDASMVERLEKRRKFHRRMGRPASKEVLSPNYIKGMLRLKGKLLASHLGPPVDVVTDAPRFMTRTETNRFVELAKNAKPKLIAISQHKHKNGQHIANVQLKGGSHGKDFFKNGGKKAYQSHCDEKNENTQNAESTENTAKTENTQNTQNAENAENTAKTENTQNTQNAENTVKTEDTGNTVKTEDTENTDQNANKLKFGENNNRQQISTGRKKKKRVWRLKRSDFMHYYKTHHHRTQRHNRNNMVNYQLAQRNRRTSCDAE